MALKTRVRQIQRLGAGAALALLLATTGCGAFFQCEGKTDCGTNSTSTGSGDYVYVSNSTSGSEYINGYTVGTNSLTLITGFPFSLGYVPVAMAVSQNNNFLYIAAAPGTSSSGIWLYTITSTGALSGGTQLTDTEIGSMVISPDGNFLYTIDSSTGSILSEYTVTTSTGALAGPTTIATPGASSLTGCTPTSATPSSQSCTVTVAPTENYVAVALNTTGTVYYPYSSTGGITNSAYTLISPLSSTSGDYSLAFDNSNYLYVASTSALTSYGSLSAPVTESTYSGYGTGATPRAVTVSTGYNYLFTADEGTSDIQSFSISNGTITAFSTPYVLGPQNVEALGVDRSGTYLLAAGYSTTNGLQMFTISSTTLNEVADQGTGSATTIPVVMALTH